MFAELFKRYASETTTSSADHSLARDRCTGSSLLISLTSSTALAAAPPELTNVPLRGQEDAANGDSTEIRHQIGGQHYLDKMRVFLAGASGVIGLRLTSLLAAAGHEVTGMTRSPEKAAAISALGAAPVICDVFDSQALTSAVIDFRPDAVLHELTDLPDDVTRIAAFGALNARIRREGTRNLLSAANAAGVTSFLAQSVAWDLPGDAGLATADLERAVLDAGGVVLRYGQFYGPGTYYESQIPGAPRIEINEAAIRTVAALDAPSGVIVITDSE